MKRTAKTIAASLLLACATLMVRAHDSTFLELNDVTMPYEAAVIQTSIISFDVSELMMGDRILDIYYGSDRERWKSVETVQWYINGSFHPVKALPPTTVVTTNLYAGDYERIDTTQYYYLDGGVIYVKQGGGAGQAYYALTDHLGSYTRLYTMAGDSVLIASYDPWGNRTTTKNTLKFHRGFTGHEHLTTYGVINMNGRMYDPTVGRFLAPDNFVQMPDFSQSFNRYSYCLNNPLKYTDPSGESVIGFLTVAMMAYIGGLQANFGNVDGNPFNPGNWNWKSLRTYYGIVSGAFSGGQMAGYQWAAWTSKLDVPGIITNGSIHAAGEVAFNGICNAIDKRGFFEGWQYSAMFGFIDGAYGGYTAANENGENFWWGGGMIFDENYMRSLSEQGKIVNFQWSHPGHVDNVRRLKVYTNRMKNKIYFNNSMFNTTLKKINTGKIKPINIFIIK